MLLFYFDCVKWISDLCSTIELIICNIRHLFRWILFVCLFGGGGARRGYLTYQCKFQIYVMYLVVGLGDECQLILKHVKL